MPQISMCVMLAGLLLAGCAAVPPLDITNCDPRQQKDCYSVSEEFLQDHFEMKDRYILNRKALEYCRKKI